MDSKNLFSSIDHVPSRFIFDPNNDPELGLIYQLKQDLSDQPISLPNVLIPIIYEYVSIHTSPLSRSFNLTIYRPVEQSRWYCDDFGNCVYPHPRHYPTRTHEAVYCSLGRLLCSCLYLIQRCSKCWWCPWFCACWYVIDCCCLHCQKSQRGYYKEASQLLLTSPRGNRFREAFVCSCCDKTYNMQSVPRSIHRSALFFQTCDAACVKCESEMDANSICSKDVSVFHQSFLQITSQEMDLYDWVQEQELLSRSSCCSDLPSRESMI